MMEITVTLTDTQVSALQARFGEGDDLGARLQTFCNDWLIQFERAAEDVQAAQLLAAYKTATPVDKQAMQAIVDKASAATELTVSK